MRTSEFEVLGDRDGDRALCSFCEVAEVIYLAGFLSLICHLSGRFINFLRLFSFCPFCQLEIQEPLFAMSDVSSLKSEHVFLCFLFTAM